MQTIIASRGPLTSDLVCDMAGVSYRQLDYWCRHGLVRTIGPAQPGSGGVRRFPPGEVRVVNVVARLAELGAKLDTLRQVAPIIRSFRDDEWHGELLVSKSGAVARLALGAPASFGTACWVVNLDLVVQARAA